LCLHPIFQANEIFALPTRCSQCTGSMDVCEVGTIQGVCGHRFCVSCIKKSALKHVSTGRLYKFPSSFYGLKCPVENCDNGLVSDPHIIKSLVTKDFYALFLCVAFLLSQNQTLSFAKCKVCGRKCVLDYDGKLHCYSCSVKPTARPFRLTKQGWLTKKSSGVISAWQKRYFCLDESGILSYTSREQPPNSQIGRKKILTMLTDFKTVRNDRNEDRRYRFSIASSRYDEDYELYADSLEEKEAWMNALVSWGRKKRKKTEK